MLDWNKYLKVDLDDRLVDHCRSYCCSTFQHQKKIIAEITAQLTPRTVACLGAGCLNDIPVFDFFRTAELVYLIDWVPGISEEGFKASLITRDGTLDKCGVCALPRDRRSICASYEKTASSGAMVCDNFEPSPGNNSVVRCAKFGRGTKPRFLTADITAARSSKFAEAIEKIVKFADDPEKCYHKAIKEAHRCKSIFEQMPIPSGTIDLATSSMVVSQFDAEPYAFFSKHLLDRFGDQAMRQSEKQIRPLMQQLCDELFNIQVEGHFQELYRIVNKTSGKVYFSVELFRSIPGQDSCFLVKGSAKTMEILDRFFTYDFETLPIEKTLKRANADEDGSGFSVIQSYVLTPKPTHEG